MNDHSGPGLDVLNCERGHMKIEFNKANASEIEHAKGLIEDMLKRGYTIIVEHDGETHRVKKFDAEHEVYIVTDGPKTPEKKIPMRKARASGIGRTAGG